MSLLPRMYKASTRARAEQALANGSLYYPAFCYITSENIMAWIDVDNKINYIVSDKQITDITYDNGYLFFMAGDTIIESVNIAMDSIEADKLVGQITKQLLLEEYAKKSEVASMLDNTIGDLDGSDSVVDYINTLSYNRLLNIPIINVSGTLTKAVILTSLDEGAYKITGQYVIGGENETVFTAIEPAFALVSHDDGDSKITVISSSSIRLYRIKSNGSCTSDKYITKNYIISNYTNTLDMMEYVISTIGEVTPTIVKQIMEENFENMLRENVGTVPLADIINIF